MGRENWDFEVGFEGEGGWQMIVKPKQPIGEPMRATHHKLCKCGHSTTDHTRDDAPSQYGDGPCSLPDCGCPVYEKADK